MKYYELTKEEKDLLDAYEKSEFVSVMNSKRKRLLQQYAANTLNKTKNINIRLTEKTLLKLKAKAIEEGIPYQTLASSILHKYVNK